MSLSSHWELPEILTSFRNIYLIPVFIFKMFFPQDDLQTFLKCKVPAYFVRTEIIIISKAADFSPYSWLAIPQRVTSLRIHITNNLWQPQISPTPYPRATLNSFLCPISCSAFCSQPCAPYLIGYSASCFFPCVSCQICYSALFSVPCRICCCAPCSLPDFLCATNKGFLCHLACVLASTALLHKSTVLVRANTQECENTQD